MRGVEDKKSEVKCGDLSTAQLTMGCELRGRDDDGIFWSITRSG